MVGEEELGPDSGFHTALHKPQPQGLREMVIGCKLLQAGWQAALGRCEGPRTEGRLAWPPGCLGGSRAAGARD